MTERINSILNSRLGWTQELLGNDLFVAVLLSLLAGFGLERFVTLLGMQSPSDSFLKSWVFGSAVSMLLFSLASAQFRKKPMWELAIFGQMLGVVYIALTILR